MMTKLNIKRINLFFLFFLLISVAGLNSAQAQIDEILSSGPEDANLLLKEYLRPFGSGFGAGLNSGWVNTARPYKPFGLDIRVNAAVSVAPGADQIINTRNLAFQELKYLRGPSESSTIVGANTPGSTLGKTFINPETGQEEELFSFEMPEGIGYPYIPAPMAQVTLGIMLNTDVTVRYVPTINFEDDYEVGLWGIGIKHGLNRWFKSGKTFPVDLSIQAGYTSLSATARFDIEPDNNENTRNNFSDSHWNGQSTELQSTAFTGNFLVGKRMPVLSLYGGVGYQQSKTTFLTPGNYPVVVPISPENYQTGGPVKEIHSISDPVDFELKGANKFHALAGLRIRLLILTISGSYTYSTYSTLNVGVGLSIR